MPLYPQPVTKVFFFTDVPECINDAGGTSSGFLPAQLSLAVMLLNDLNRILSFLCRRSLCLAKTIKSRKGNALFVEENAPSKLLSVHRRSVNEIETNNSCA